MNWFFEQPLVIVFLGVGLCLALGAAWSSTGRTQLLYAIGLVLSLMLAGILISNMVVTDREAIRATVLQIADAVEHNDRPQLFKHIHSSASELKKKAEAELPNYQFTECRVTRIHKIEVDRSAEPHSAIVEFNVVATGTFKQPGFEVSDSVPRWIKLQLLREKDGGWGVADYEHDNPQRMIMQGPTDKSR